MRPESSVGLLAVYCESCFFRETFRVQRCGCDHEQVYDFIMFSTSSIHHRSRELPHLIRVGLHRLAYRTNKRGSVKGETARRRSAILKYVYPTRALS